MKKIKATKDDYKNILELWERSVIATHDFLSAEDREAIKKEIPAYFPNLDVTLWYDEEVLIGFSSTHEGHLEMLFLDPNSIGKGYGKKIIKDLTANHGVTYVDVNKQNENAKTFYMKNGFIIISEDPIDDMSRPYPILHLKKA